jgi:hypothetical protein
MSEAYARFDPMLDAPLTIKCRSSYRRDWAILDPRELPVGSG